MQKGVDLNQRLLCNVCSVVQKLSLDRCDVTPTSVQHLAGVLCNSVRTCSIRKVSLANNDSVSLAFALALFLCMCTCTCVRLALGLFCFVERCSSHCTCYARHGFRLVVLELSV